MTRTQARRGDPTETRATAGLFTQAFARALAELAKALGSQNADQVISAPRSRGGSATVLARMDRYWSTPRSRG